MCYYLVLTVTSNGYSITLAMLYAYTEVWRVTTHGTMAKEM